MPSATTRKRGPRAAAFFDLDKTIIAKSSTLAFSKPFFAGGLMTRRTVLRGAFAQFVFLAQGADHDQMEKMRLFLSEMCTGWSVQTVNEIVADTLHNVIAPAVYDEALRLISDHHAAGRDVIIVSASGAEIVEPIGELLGVDHVIATQMKVELGRYTGEIEHYVYAENKATAIVEMATERGYDLAESYAYSDSITDVHMLEIVGHPHAVNPDKELRKRAEQNQWPILRFEKPIALRSNVPLPKDKPTLIALGTGAVLTAGAAAYFTARRRARRKLGIT
jgi:HAD superfamily hydrolase (TIGR01490 family)